MLSKCFFYWKLPKDLAKTNKQTKTPWLKGTNCLFSGNISIVIGPDYCHSSDYKITTAPQQEANDH